MIGIDLFRLEIYWEQKCGATEVQTSVNVWRLLMRARVVCQPLDTAPSVQPGITPYRAHAHKRYLSIESCPRARFSDFFRATQNEM